MTIAETIPTDAAVDVPTQGSFCWDVAADHWGWSPSHYRLHGYEPGEVLPTTAVTLDHKHHEDLHACVDAVHAGIVSDRVIVHEHRVVDIRGTVIPVVMVARATKDERGEVSQVRGSLVPTQPGELRPDEPDHHRVRTTLLQRLFGIERAAARVLATRTLPLQPASAALAAPGRAV